MASASSSSALCPLQQHRNSVFPKYPSGFRPLHRVSLTNQKLGLSIRASSAIALDPVCPPFHVVHINLRIKFYGVTVLEVLRVFFWKIIFFNVV